MNHPKVLVVGINPWVDNSGINTLINFFQDWGIDNLAHIYTRDGLPNTVICSKFFQISELRLAQGLLNRKIQAGKQVENTSSTPSSSDSNKTLYKRFGNIAVIARELLWKFSKWDSDHLKQFIDDFEPDVLFFPTYSVVYMSRLQNYIADYAKCPIVLYASDDNYSYKSIIKTPLSLLHRFWIRKHLRKLFKRCSELMVIAPKVKEEYDNLFGADSIVMTKGIDLDKYPYKNKKLCYPIKIVYTGKMIYGRWKSLARLSEAIGKINAHNDIFELDIYTTDQLSAKQLSAFSNKGTILKGAIPFSEVPNVLECADILVFAESLEPKYKNLARLSLSTKLTDYLRSGKCIFAIGDADIAPIDYLRQNEAAIIVNSYAEIQEKLMLLVDNQSLIESVGRQAYECAKRNHNRQNQQMILERTINKAAGMRYGK